MIEDIPPFSQCASSSMCKDSFAFTFAGFLSPHVGATSGFIQTGWPADVMCTCK